MHRRPCWVEISTGAFEHNYRVLAEACGASAAPSAASPIALLAIVKANAYGHGIDLCAAAAVRAGARWLGVTSVEEGVLARAICDDAGFPGVEILAIGGPFRGQGAAAIDARLTAVVWETWQLEELANAARAAGCGHATVPVHLELDTGMSRQGVGETELDALLIHLTGDNPLRLDGLMTHLYAAEERDGDATRSQVATLERMAGRVVEATIAEAPPMPKQRPLWLHVGNSAAVMAGEPIEALIALCGRWGLRPMARPGLALYGLTPRFSPDDPVGVTELGGRLRRVLEWKTQVVSVRSVDAGQVVGYNGTFVATEPMRLALLAVGYGDGLNRALSNRGQVLIGGCRAPIAGRISMDQTVVDITEIPGVAAGDEAVLLGRQVEDCITAEEHAAWAYTIPWEIFTSIAARVGRQRAGNADRTHG